jgi:replicative DNA helicase
MARPTLDKSPKFKALVRRLGLPRPYVRGLLEVMWDVCHEVGNPRLGSPEEVEAAAEWPGEPGVFFAALRDGRWIDELPDGAWEVHDYYDHAPEYVIRRGQRAVARHARGKTLSDVRREAAQKRWNRQGQRREHTSDMHIVLLARPRPGPGPGPAPLPAAGAIPENRVRDPRPGRSRAPGPPREVRIPCPASDAEWGGVMNPSTLRVVDEAERAVLGAMLRDNAVIADVVPIRRADYFRMDAHQVLFAGITDLFQQGQPVDLVTLAEALHRQNQIERVGGYGFLGDLWESGSTGTNAAHHARIVRDKALLRALCRAGAEIEAAARDQAGSPEQLLDEAEKTILAIAQQGIESQARPLGRLIGLALAHHASRISVPSFVVSLEQRGEELAERLLCCKALVDGHRLRSGAPMKPEERSRLTRAGDRLRDAPVFIDDAPSQRMLRIAANARRLKLREHIGLVVIDYLQLIEPENRREPRHEQVAGISRRLKQFARELNVPVVALAQLNREVENRVGQEPRLSDLRESGAIEADADVVLLLHRQGEGDLIQVLIAKQRNGPTGRVNLFFRRQHQRFENAIREP